MAWLGEDEAVLLKKDLQLALPPLTPTSHCIDEPAEAPTAQFSFLAELPVANADRELEDYLDSPKLSFKENPLLFWYSRKDSLPRLYSLAMRSLCLCASSAAVERLFSVSGNIVTPHRNRLSDENVDALSFLQSNSDWV